MCHCELDLFAGALCLAAIGSEVRRGFLHFISPPGDPVRGTVWAGLPQGGSARF